MKIVEALKKKKDLKRKADDIKKKIGEHCADLDHLKPVYDDQKKQVTEWLQAHRDILSEILRLHLAIQRTNLRTMVTIELNGNHVTKCIAAWVIRRKDLAKEEQQAWLALSDKGLKPNAVIDPETKQSVAVNVRRHFDVKVRDAMLSALGEEPSLIDAALEVKNAVTDLIEEEEA